jgi:hypothetical protein
MGLSRPDSHQKVLERLATSDKATIVVERQTGGKIRVTSGSFNTKLRASRCLISFGLGGTGIGSTTTGFPFWCSPRAMDQVRTIIFIGTGLAAAVGLWLLGILLAGGITWLW